MDRRQFAAFQTLCLGTSVVVATVPPSRAAERATVQGILDGRELCADEAGQGLLLPAHGSLESSIRSSVPGVSMPSLPRFGMPRLFR
jgi:hypothetical protein